MAAYKYGVGNEFKMGLEHLDTPERLLSICQNDAENKLKRLLVAKDKIIKNNHCSGLKHLKHL